MKPNASFLIHSKEFWANIRTISEQVGYTIRGENKIKVPRLDEMASALQKLNLDASHIVGRQRKTTRLGQAICDYYQFRADVLNQYVEPRLMDAQRAKAVFDELCSEFHPTCPLPLNKQKGDKKAAAYLTCIVNILIEHYAIGHSCDFDPRSLTTFTRDDRPLRTLSRRFDGAFPATTNPIAVWEIKEYYYTTTFGSRVADGIYESLLDGLELEEVRNQENIHTKHYLFVDAHYTWWECGKSYLCRLIDMLHMGYVDEILFGNEIVEELPRIVKEWIHATNKK